MTISELLTRGSPRMESSSSGAPPCSGDSTRQGRRGLRRPGMASSPSRPCSAKSPVASPPTPSPSLRATLQEAQKHAERLARSYATSLSLLQDAQAGEDAENSRRALPAPVTVWERIREARQTFEDYCQRWNECTQRVARLEQLFVA